VWRSTRWTPHRTHRTARTARHDELPDDRTARTAHHDEPLEDGLVLASLDTPLTVASFTREPRRGLAPGGFR
jgi:hypothetical protein